MLLGTAAANAGTVTVPYTGSYDETSAPSGDYDAIGGLDDVGLFNLVAGTNTFTGSIYTPNDSSDAFVIGIGPDQTITGASILFGTNLDMFNPLFAAPGPIWTLEESSPTPTIFAFNLGVNGMDSAQSLSAIFSKGAGIYSMLIGNGTFATNNSGPVAYSMSFTVTSTIAATPIPAALPLFASALGGLGFVGWRRKKAAAAA
jgi:hypothetical protein